MSRLQQGLLIALVAAVGLVAGLYYGGGLSPSKPEARPSPYAHLGGDFTLTGGNGPVSLHDFAGKVVTIYFGYTSCPDVCPAALGMLGQALRKLPEEEAAQVQPLFISVDPDRDTPERMQNYVTFFFPSMLGLTGTAEQLAEVAKRYAIYFARVELEDSALGYAMDHSSVIFILNREGRIQEVSQHGDTEQDLLRKLRDVLAL